MTVEPISPDSSPTGDSPEAPEKGLNGRWVVVGMFGFAFLMTGALWLYWDLYTRDFRELQAAINVEFPGSSPRVIGGKPKSHQPNSVLTLRMVIRVEFNPEEQEKLEEGNRMARRLVELSQKYLDVPKYEKLEIHLVHYPPQQPTQHREIVKPVSEWLEEVR